MSVAARRRVLAADWQWSRTAGRWAHAGRPLVLMPAHMVADRRRIDADWTPAVHPTAHRPA